MTFCRSCGAGVDADDRFCARCGRRLNDGERSPWWRALGRALRLNTPYPYAALLFLGYALWSMQPSRVPVDYASLRMELELQGESGVPEADVFRHHLSLVIENRGDAPVAEIPIEFRARLEPDQPVEVVSDFLGRRLVILRNGETLPLVVILGDELAAGEKRRYAIDGIVTTAPPAEVIYEVLGEGTGEVLASLHAAIPAPGENRAAPGPELAAR